MALAGKWGELENIVLREIGLRKPKAEYSLMWKLEQDKGERKGEGPIP